MRFTKCIRWALVSIKISRLALRLRSRDPKPSCFGTDLPGTKGRTLGNHAVLVASRAKLHCYHVQSANTATENPDQICVTCLTSTDVVARSTDLGTQAASLCSSNFLFLSLQLFRLCASFRQFGAFFSILMQKQIVAVITLVERPRALSIPLFLPFSVGSVKSIAIPIYSLYSIPRATISSWCGSWKICRLSTAFPCLCLERFAARGSIFLGNLGQHRRCAGLCLNVREFWHVLWGRHIGWHSLSLETLGITWYLMH